MVVHGKDGVLYVANLTAADSIKFVTFQCPVVHKDIEVVTAESSYTWNGETYTTSGNYSKTFTLANGCDSTVTLHLTFCMSIHGDVYITCPDPSYTWNGVTYTTSGNYSKTFTLANGCDSTATLHLRMVVCPIYDTITVITAEADYFWKLSNMQYTESGYYDFTVRVYGNCDSIVTLHLIIQDYIEIDGVKWAPRNVKTPGTFTEFPHFVGMFYQWNRPIGWNNAYLENHLGGTTWDASMPTGNTWEEVNNVCPAGWRLPTREEFQSLNNHTSEPGAPGDWGSLESQFGRFFGKGNPRLFLPVEGYRLPNDGTLSLVIDGVSFYWCSTKSGSDRAVAYKIAKYHSVETQPLNCGCFVRCVKE
jgi:uncharacterized protein (TIGR02145 family)